MRSGDEQDQTAAAMVEYAEELTRWRERRRLSKGKLALLMTYDRSYVSQIEGCHLPPTEDFTRRAEAVLRCGGALLRRWEAYRAAKAEGARSHRRPVWRASEEPARDLKTLEFVAWIADHSRLSFEEAYEAVVERVERIETAAPAQRHALAHRRTGVSREQLAEALASYYRPSADENDARFYRARVGGIPLTLSILVRADWLGAAVRLGTDQERFRLASPTFNPTDDLIEDAVAYGALRRLADVEVSGTRFVNNPMYRLLDVDIERDRIEATVALTDFAAYALTMDLLEREIVDALAEFTREFPLRDILLPGVSTALAFDQRLCVGGPVCLLAIARPSSQRRPADQDYLLVIQERSKRVLNAMGKLAVIPKAFHGPVGDANAEARLSASLEREFEEELLGREDLEQLTEESYRLGDPLHPASLSEPLRWLMERRHTDAYRLECTGFGINLVSGNYEFPCLMVIEDEEWWARYGARVEANWEVARIRRYSSRDTAGLTALAADPRWSNEGLFAFLEGLRRLAELDTVSRLALPMTDLEV